MFIEQSFVLSTCTGMVADLFHTKGVHDGVIIMHTFGHKKNVLTNLNNARTEPLHARTVNIVHFVVV